MYLKMNFEARDSDSDTESVSKSNCSKSFTSGKEEGKDVSQSIVSSNATRLADEDERVKNAKDFNPIESLLATFILEGDFENTAWVSMSTGCFSLLFSRLPCLSLVLPAS